MVQIIPPEGAGWKYSRLGLELEQKGGWQIPPSSPATPGTRLCVLQRSGNPVCLLWYFPAGYHYTYTFQFLDIRPNSAKVRTRTFPRHELLTRIEEASVPQFSHTIARDDEGWTTRNPTMLLSSSTFVTTSALRYGAAAAARPREQWQGV
eukprot:1190709-Prorocentrum_minimum.AAC.1